MNTLLMIGLLQALAGLFTGCEFIRQHSDSEPQTAKEKFNIIFKHDFESNTSGPYKKREFNKNWPDSEWKNYSNAVIQEFGNNKVLQVTYPEGKVLHGGQWLTPLGGKHIEVYYSYNILFRPGFIWREGGKIPGPAGKGRIGSQPVTGGLDVPEEGGWSNRCMFKPDGTLAMYVYHQDMDGQYGTYIYFHNEDGTKFQFDVSDPRWYNITIRLVLNTIGTEGKGNRDGVLEGFIDGELKVSRTDMRWRNYSNMYIGYSLFSTFFGGSDPAVWAPLREEWIYFDDFMVWTYGDGVEGVPRGNVPSPPGTAIAVPPCSPSK